MNTWDQKDVTCISKSFENVSPSETEALSLESTIPSVVDTVLNDLQPKSRVKPELRVLFLVYPKSCGLNDINDIEAEDQHLKKSFENYTKNSSRASVCDLRLSIVWVSEVTKSAHIQSGGSENLGIPALCTPGNLKLTMCQLVQKHFHLQLIRVTNIPMSKADGDKSKDSKKETLVETVDLLSCGAVGDTELILVWEREGTISKAFDKSNQSYDAFPAASIRKTTAMALCAKPTQTLLKHLTKKPATLLAARRPAASAASAASSARASAAGRLPKDLWLLRDHGSAILLTQLHLADPLLRLPLPPLRPGGCRPVRLHS